MQSYTLSLFIFFRTQYVHTSFLNSLEKAVSHSLHEDFIANMNDPRVYISSSLYPWFMQ